MAGKRINNNSSQRRYPVVSASGFFIFTFLLDFLMNISLYSADLRTVNELDEFYTRLRVYNERKPYEKLIDKDGYSQAEILIFYDRKYGHEVWQITNDFCENGYLSINFQLWNANGSMLAFRTTRNSDAGGAGDNDSWIRPGRYTMNADGSHMRYIRTKNVCIMQEYYQRGIQKTRI